MSTHRRTGAAILLMLAAVALATAAVVLGLRAAEGPDVVAPTARESTPSATPSATPAGSGSDDGPLVDVEGAATATDPVRVRVPSLGISSRLDRLGVDAHGVLDTPPHWKVAGWYEGGPRPGETGPAVIAGHIDSPTGPAVFARLAEIRPGDLVEVESADGSVVRFRVDRLAQAPKDAFPTKAVYGPTPDSQLRLITCSGAYDAAGGGYQDNLIVFATKVGG